ncbi:MAG: MASE1 domain-containing protein [Steroidobacteraceae bacterium]
MSEFVQREAGNRGSPGEAVMARFGGRAGVLIAFFVAYATLVWLGYEFKESVSEPAVMWPSAGLLFAALWLSDRSLWPAVLLVQLGVEMSFAALLQHPFLPVNAFLYVVANSVDALVGASLARWLIHDRSQVRTAQTLQFMFATAAGALAGAALGAWVNSSGYYSPQSYVHQIQIWWVSNWLGSLAIAPVVICWLIPVRKDFPELALRSRLEVLVLAVLLVVAAMYVFTAAADGPASLLQLPIIMVVLLVYAAYRVPPRWSATLAMGMACLCSELASELKGPFIAADPFARNVQVQTFLAAAAAMTYVLATALTEMRITLGRLRVSESRYRNFVELSTEAVWRVELDQPMSVRLPEEQQIAWLRAHGRVAECNLSYQQFDAVDPAHDTCMWRREKPWSSLYEQHLGQAAKQNFSMDGLRFTVTLHGRPHTFLTSFSGVVRDDHLLRIWGVARDITDLVELTARLLRDQERLKSYARQIVTAEEKARRATAVDLHDGIGQSLVGMSMTLEVAREHAPPDVRMLLDEVRVRLREVQERTRHVISDLSPPGLYDLGLAPALQWLSVYVRGHDRLHVELETRVREDVLKLDIRVLVFKLVRELLRNVVKHAGVSAARVIVHGDADVLRVEVADAGKGFEWQMDMFGARSGGFGLWSIADRVHEAGGKFTVDTAPGRGSRFDMEFPLRTPAAVELHQMASMAVGKA